MGDEHVRLQKLECATRDCRGDKCSGCVAARRRLDEVSRLRAQVGLAEEADRRGSCLLAKAQAVLNE